MGICVVWADAVLQIVLCGGGDLGGESGGKHAMVEIFPLRSARVGVAVAHVLEGAADVAAAADSSRRDADRGLASAKRSERDSILQAISKVS